MFPEFLNYSPSFRLGYRYLTSLLFYSLACFLFTLAKRLAVLSAFPLEMIAGE
jgi:hypothetical protein